MNVQRLVDDVLHEHGLGRGTGLSASLVDAVVEALGETLRELAPALLDDVENGTDLSTPLYDLGLPQRAANCLYGGGVHTLRDALAHSVLPEGLHSMHRFRNIVPRCVVDLLVLMESLGVDHPDLAEAKASDWWPADR